MPISNKKTCVLTLGLAPCWDIRCYSETWRWGGHDTISRQTAKPAGKSLNVARALAEMRYPTVACGLWGEDDRSAAINQLNHLKPYLRCCFTPAAGHTRQNITLIDTRHKKEMHLRAPNSLINTSSMRQLKNDFRRLIKPGSICVFSGVLPADKYFDDLQALFQMCRRKGAKLVVDSSGPALRRIIETETLWLMKPNVSELRELLGSPVANHPESLYKAARSLLSRAANILISRDKQGAMLVNNRGCWTAAVEEKRTVESTVGCGDYLLAGFIQKWLISGRMPDALTCAVKVAAAKAWGLTDQSDWRRPANHIQVRINKNH